MTKEDRIVALEREIIYLRKAAVKVVLSLVEGAIMSPKEREVLARSLELDAKDADEETARLYSLIASALRNCNENA
ncbi:hypothetical protein PVV74_19975 [Roseovarius sp. SK2]|uniref:hypothetical protein n=1 Tax=Roseovarius sp. SK2 TaxID=3028381 RepID=UPI00237B9E68|nr:hypothetical protein [Roseovarius sp. SK2]MDD9727728.1 hypothetical protein [Roseovarius sp. SK2]